MQNGAELTQSLPAWLRVVRSLQHNASQQISPSERKCSLAKNTIFSPFSLTKKTAFSHLWPFSLEGQISDYDKIKN